MIRAPNRKTCALLCLIVLGLIGGCTRLPPIAQTTLKPKSVAELEKHLLANPADVELFRASGPFNVAVHEDRELRLSATERISIDLYSAAPAEQMPLAIFMHGYDSSKDAHANQAKHLASWGFHCLTVQLSKTGPWVRNGRTLGRIVSLIQKSPDLIDRRVDVNRIVLIGHSFGAASIAVALAEGAPAAGAILLDPAAAVKEMPNFLRKINKPLLILGADGEISTTRNRDWFYRHVRGGVAEVSIRDATHEDAQYPSETALQHFGFDPYTTEELQITFVSAITAAAFSLSATGTFDYAWTGFGPVLKSGKFFNAKKK